MEGMLIKIPATGHWRYLYAVMGGLPVRWLVNPDGVVVSIMYRSQHPLCRFYDLDLQQN